MGISASSRYDIVEIPLYFEGKVEDRVKGHILALQNRRDDLERADVILIAAHSQGTPTAALMVESLITSRQLHGINIDANRQKICILGLAGICHGPFPIIKTVIPAGIYR